MTDRNEIYRDDDTTVVRLSLGRYEVHREVWVGGKKRSRALCCNSLDTWATLQIERHAMKMLLTDEGST